MKRTLLVLDDDRSILELLKFVLKDDYQVIAISDPYKALTVLKTMPVDGVISDISMPEIDGISFLKMVRDNLGEMEIPFIMLSSKDSSNDKITCLDNGADDYMVKPFNPNELKARLRSIYRRVERLIAA